ncbi:MAG: repeat, subfamily [Chthonomonadales bacterium]|nr:repeat, subfamily [Chthonomonadales bacterium]
MQAAQETLPASKIQLLLDKGADPNVRDDRRNTVLIHLAWWTQYDMIIGGKEESHAEAVRILADHGADINTRGSGGMTALMWAAGWNHPPTLRALLACGAKVDIQDDQGRTALTWAARGGQKSDEVQTLLRAGAHIRLQDAMLLDDFPRAAKLLTDSSATTGRGPYGETLLMLAAEKGRRDILQTLLERGAEVNAHDEQGMTALMLAIGGRPQHSQSGRRIWRDKSPTDTRIQMMKALLAKHADPKLKNKDGDTALSIAQEIHNTAAIELLTGSGAPPVQ